jgi:hypothetical protein
MEIFKLGTSFSGVWCRYDGDGSDSGEQTEAKTD